MGSRPRCCRGSRDVARQYICRCARCRSRGRDRAGWWSLVGLRVVERDGWGGGAVERSMGLGSQGLDLRVPRRLGAGVGREGGGLGVLCPDGRDVGGGEAPATPASVWRQGEERKSVA